MTMTVMDICFVQIKFEHNTKMDKQSLIICLDEILEINLNGECLLKDH